MSAGGARRGRRDNGLSAAAYAAAGDVDPRVGEHLLDVLAASGIAAYLQPASDLNPITRTTTMPPRPTDRLYVDRAHLTTARDYVARLAAEEEQARRAPDVDAEWARIVAGFHAEVDPAAQPWPAAENLDPTAENPDPTAAVHPTPGEHTPSDPTAGLLGPPGTAHPTGPTGTAHPTGPTGTAHPTGPPDPTGPGGPGPADRAPGRTGRQSRPEAADEDLWPPDHPTESTERPDGRPIERRRRPAARTPDEPSLLDALDTFGAGLPGEPTDDEGYTPPPPPPLPRISKYAAAGVLGVVVGFVLFLFPHLLPLDPDVVMLFGFTCVLAGFVTLVWRLRPGDDEDAEDDPENGAVV